MCNLRLVSLEDSVQFSAGQGRISMINTNGLNNNQRVLDYAMQGESGYSEDRASI